MVTYDELADMGFVPQRGTISYYRWVITDYPDIIKIEKSSDPLISLNIFVKPDYDEDMIDDFIDNHFLLGMTYKIIVEE